MTEIILYNENRNRKVINSKKKIRKNLDVLLKIKVKIFLLERKIEKLNKTSPIDAFIAYRELVEIKNVFYILQILVMLSNKLMNENGT